MWAHPADELLPALTGTPFSLLVGPDTQLPGLPSAFQPSLGSSLPTPERAAVKQCLVLGLGHQQPKALLALFPT